MNNELLIESINSEHRRSKTYYVHLPHDGSFLSHFFFFLLQFKHTLDDFAPPSEEGDGGSDAGSWSDLESCILDGHREKHTALKG